MRAVAVAALVVSLAFAPAVRGGSEFEAFLDARPSDVDGKVRIWRDVASAELATRQAPATQQPGDETLVACTVPSGTRALVDRESGTWAWRVRVIEGPHRDCTGVLGPAYVKTAREREQAEAGVGKAPKTSAKPPTAVGTFSPFGRMPPGLSAAEYYQLGMDYKAAGWPEQARDALTRSIAADPQGIGRKAQVFLTAYVPPSPVSPEAAQKNIAGFNQMARGDFRTAMRTFEECIQQFPDFEWPYGNLSLIYRLLGRNSEAKAIVERALKVNPSYANGWAHLAESHLLNGDVKRARQAANKALEIDPEHEIAKKLLERISA